METLLRRKGLAFWEALMECGYHYECQAVGARPGQGTQSQPGAACPCTVPRASEFPLPQVDDLASSSSSRSGPSNA